MVVAHLVEAQPINLEEEELFLLKSPRIDNPPEPVRWVVLVFFCWLGGLQGLVWLTQSASPVEVIAYYDWNNLGVNSDEQIGLLLNWGPIAYIPIVPFVMLVVARGGTAVWWVALTGGIFVLAGSFVRLIPTIAGEAFRTSYDSLYLLHFGQFLNGIAGPMLNSTVSALSAAWFPQNQRTLATSLAYGCSIMGPALGFLFAFFVKDTHQFEVLLIAEVVAAVVGLVAWILMPKLPKLAPSVSAEEKRRFIVPIKSSWGNFYKEFVNCSHNRSFMLLAISGGVVTGVFNCWSGSLANSLGDQLGESLSQWMGFVANISNLVGNNIIGPISERWFKLRFKKLILILYVVQLVGYFVFVLSLPLGTIAPTPLIPLPAKWLLGILCIASSCLGAATPLFYELGAEMTYPSDEGVSAGIISGLNNVGGLILLFVIPHIDKTWHSLIMAGTVVISTVMTLFIAERYKRTALDIHAASALSEPTSPRD